MTTVIKRGLGPSTTLEIRHIPGIQKAPLGWRIKNMLRWGYIRGAFDKWMACEAISRFAGIATITCEVSAVKRELYPHEREEYLLLKRELAQTEDPAEQGRIEAQIEQILTTGGKLIDYGVLGRRLVTNAGVNFFVDAWQNLTEIEVLIYHGVGTDNTAESAGDTALGAESTTALNPDSTRATGSQTEGASANIFRTVGTVTFDGSAAIVEHGLLSQAATGGGVLWDRTVHGAINVVDGDSIQYTHETTINSGS
jgi:hypothetical protein